MFSHGFYVLFGSLIVQFDAVAWTSFFKYHRWICIYSWICICSLWIKQNLLTTRGIVICAVWSSHRSIPHLLTLLLPWRMSKVLRLWLKVLKMTKDRDISHTLWTRNSFYLFFFLYNVTSESHGSVIHFTWSVSGDMAVSHRLHGSVIFCPFWPFSFFNCNFMNWANGETPEEISYKTFHRKEWKTMKIETWRELYFLIIYRTLLLRMKGRKRN